MTGAVGVERQSTADESQVCAAGEAMSDRGGAGRSREAGGAEGGKSQGVSDRGGAGTARWRDRVTGTARQCPTKLEPEDH